MHSYFSALSNRAVAYWTAVSFLEHSKSMASVAVSSAICCVVSLLLPVTSPNGQLLNVVHPYTTWRSGLLGACRCLFQHHVTYKDRTFIWKTTS